MRAWLAACLAAALAFACGRPAETSPPSKYLTVFVSKDGEIAADGQEVSLSRLEGELDTAKATGAVILFAREPSERGRAAHGMLVLKTIQARGLKLRFCTARDCSDAIGPDGRLRPE
jgi:hypothetical protein